MFLDLLDEFLNAVVFALLGLEFIIIYFQAGLVVATFAAIGVTLLARALTVGLPIALAPRAFKLPDGAWKVLTWGALRGGISVALAGRSSPSIDTVASLGLTFIVTNDSRSRISVMALWAAFLVASSIVSLCLASAVSSAAMALG